MKKTKARTFSSLDEILSTYMPKHHASRRSVTSDDPKVAGKSLAQKMIEAMRAEMAKK